MANRLVGTDFRSVALFDAAFVEQRRARYVYASLLEQILQENVSCVLYAHVMGRAVGLCPAWTSRGQFEEFSLLPYSRKREKQMLVEAVDPEQFFASAVSRLWRAAAETLVSKKDLTTALKRAKRFASRVRRTYSRLIEDGLSTLEQLHFFAEVYSGSTSVEGAVFQQLLAFANPESDRRGEAACLIPLGFSDFFPHCYLVYVF